MPLFFAFPALLGTKLSLHSPPSGPGLATTGCAQQRTHSQGNPHPPHRERLERQSLFGAHHHRPSQRSRRRPPLPPQALSRAKNLSCAGPSATRKPKSASSARSARRTTSTPTGVAFFDTNLNFWEIDFPPVSANGQGAGPSLSRLRALQNSRKSGRLQRRSRCLRHQRRRPSFLQTLRLQHSLEARQRCRNAATRHPLQSSVAALLSPRRSADCASPGALFQLRSRPAFFPTRTARSRAFAEERPEQHLFRCGVQYLKPPSPATISRKENTWNSGAPIKGRAPLGPPWHESRPPSSV